MRRPPDKDGNAGVTDHDVDTSNATLNTLFGGARQKSWMTGPRGAPIRPTPRTITPKTPVPQVVSRQTTAVLPSPASSVEPSPILSHTSLMNGSRSDRPSNNENQRPTSNTLQQPPSKPKAHPPSQAPLALREEPNSQRVSSPKQPFRTQQPNRVEIRDTERPTAAIPSITSPPVETNRAGLHTTAEPLQSPTLSDYALALAESRSSSGRPTSRHASVPSAPTPLQNAEPQVSRPELPDQGPSPIRISSSSPRAAPGSLPLPSTMLSKNRAPRSGAAASTNPNKRQRTQGPTMPPLKPRVALINAHIASVGGNQNLNNGLERPRFQLLIEACNTEDSFYVALHQLFCVWDSKRQDILGIQFLPPGGNLSLAFKILGQLIRDNEGLAPNHLKWFAQFPSPLGDLLRTSDGYRQEMQRVGAFLGKLTSQWAGFSRECSARRYPPLVDELVSRMGLLSPTLQQIVFTATRRNLGVGDDKIGQEMESLFLHDRKCHQELALQMDTARPPSEGEVRERNNALVEKYSSLHNQYSQHQSRLLGSVGGAPVTQSPSIPNNVNPQSTIAPSNRSSIDINQAAWNQNAHNPDVSGNWQYPNPQAQPTHTAPTGSHNPPLLSAAGRPPSVTGQRAYADTPSPTFMQNLSMQSPTMPSPVQQDVQWQVPLLRSNSGQMQPGQPGQQGQSGQAPMTYMTPYQNGMVSQNTQQSLDPRVNNMTQNQFALQQYQQQQHMAAQAQWQQQQHQHQHQHLHQQTIPSQPVAQLQPTQYTQQTIQQQNQQQPVTQQMLNQQQQQQQNALQQQILSMNRAAQLRNNSVPGQQQRFHSRTNNVSPGRPNPSIPAQAPAALSLSPAQTNGILLQAYHQAVSSQNVQRPLIPPVGYTYAAAPINADLTALHQAHVRSPRLVPADFEPSDGPEQDPTRRFYQTVSHFALPPVKVPMAVTLSKFEFLVSTQTYPLIPKDKRPTTNRLATREYRSGTLQYRLRCIQTKREVTKCLLQDWVVSETQWPESIFIEVNGQHLEVRRKTHHGKDLPIDITRYILAPDAPDGSTNRVRISVPRLRKALKESWYFLAVEVIEILQHKQIMEMCSQSQRIPSTETLAGIKKSFLGSSDDDDDDDFAMVVSDLSVDLADPFTARIFDIPVRGRSCLHRECFDLETFLLTRTSKPKRPAQPSMIDVWKCPLCGRDARPYTLQIIDFFVEVRAKLAAENNLDVKAILIAADGSWRPKPEPQPTMKRKATNGLDDDESSEDEAAFKTAQHQQTRQSSAQRKTPIEIIDLDD